MVHAKNYEAVSTFVKVMQIKLLASFFPDTVYAGKPSYGVFAVDCSIYAIYHNYENPTDITVWPETLRYSAIGREIIFEIFQFPTYM